MKKFLNYGLALFAAFAVTTFVACSDDDDKVKSYDLTISLNPTDVDASNIGNVKVIINGVDNDTILLNAVQPTTVTLTQGVYQITVSGKVKDEATAYVTGSASVELYQEQTATVNLTKYNQSPLVFKTIYNVGTVMGYVLDCYVEVANNSDEVQYLDGLMLACPLANLKAQNAWQQEYPDFYNEGGALNGIVIAFPGNGTDYPLQPGQAVTVADEAQNHKLSYGTDESKKEAYSKAPDLSNADFEKYFGTGDIDNESVPNMVTVSMRSGSTMKQWAFGVAGRAYMLIKLPEGTTPQQFVADESNFTTYPGTTSSTLYMKIPSKYVLDAVDVYQSTVDPADHYPFFAAKDDATGIPGGAMYSSQPVRRKVSKIENGRVYYKDTNNSADDFYVSEDNTPGWTPTAVD
ncbi:MAG: DUF4876 domain-containing protein [Prevotella sp.]|nr:DUF4876 domain-containing protein [Prevotella sp.]